MANRWLTWLNISLLGLTLGQRAVDELCDWFGCVLSLLPQLDLGKSQLPVDCNIHVKHTYFTPDPPAFLKKCQVFGNFWTVKWQFSIGSALHLNTYETNIINHSKKKFFRYYLILSPRLIIAHRILKLINNIPYVTI